MLGTALYTITTAAIVLIADIADGTPANDHEGHLTHIYLLMRCLRDMEFTYPVSLTVLKQVKYLMRRCNVPPEPREVQNEGGHSQSPGFVPRQNQTPISLPGDLLPEANGFLMTMSECDALESFGPWAYDFDASMQ